MKIYGVPSQNAIVVRGTPDELLLAQKLINDLDKPRPEVVVDIAIMEVSKNWERTLGIRGRAVWGLRCSRRHRTHLDQRRARPTGSTNSSTNESVLLRHGPSEGDGFCGHDWLGDGESAADRLEYKILQNPRIRATDSQKATMKIGERIP